MLILDAQVHSWYSDRPSRPWDPSYRPVHWNKQSYLQSVGQTNSPAMVLDEMAEAGVDGAMLTPVGVYGTNIELELEAAEERPDKFQVIGVVDHMAPDLAQQLEAARSRGLRGIRMIPMREPERVARREFDTFLSVCRDLGLVVTLSLSHPLDPNLVELLRENSEVFFYIDHLGAGLAPPVLEFRPEQPFRNLDAVIALAELDNVGIKLTGAPSLSNEQYPFRDIWDPVRRLIDAFGVERMSWGSDYSRTAGLYSYWHGVNYLRELPYLSDEQRTWLYGATLMERTGWQPDQVSLRTGAG